MHTFSSIISKAMVSVLSVFTVPSQPTNLHPSRVTATSIELTWTRPSHQGENIISYELYWNDSKTMVGNVMLHIFDHTPLQPMPCNEE